MKHEPGVYFGMSESDYFADESIGSSDLKTLARSPADWWWYSSHNALRPPEQESDGKRFGSALHKALLEGLEAYEATYFIRPAPPEGSYRTIDDLKALLEASGHAYKKSARKDELIATVVTHFPNVIIYDRWLEEQAAEFAGRDEISEAWDQAIRLMARIVKAHPELKDAFIGGAPEVTVFWDEDGIRFRSRFDYLKAQGVFDLKSIANWRGDDFRKACLKEIANRSYDVQAAHYIDARAQMVKLMREGRVFGEVDPAFPKELLKAPAFAFVFVFMQTIGSPRALPIVFPQGNTVHETGQRVKAAAIENYKTYRERFGLAEMWVEVDQLWTPGLDDWAGASFWKYGS